MAALAAVVLLGPAGAAMVGASAVMSIRPLPVADRIVTGAIQAMAGFAAGVMYRLIGGEAGATVTTMPSLLAREVTFPAPDTFARLILPFAAAAAVQVLVNHGIVRLRRERGGHQARWPAGTGAGTLPLLASDLGFAGFGLVIAALWPVLGLFAAAIVVVPLLVSRWSISQFAQQQHAQAATLAALCQAVGTKDLETRGHGERVSGGARRLARQIGLSEPRTEAVAIAGLLHDVGKLGVPTRILAKDGRLTEEEAAAIQLHPRAGLTIVADIAFLGEALSGIMHHHERMDGCGYPMGLAGDEIPQFARIIAVADAFDSITSDRPYRRGLGTSEALAELRRCAGSQFDPALVDAFIAAMQ